MIFNPEKTYLLDGATGTELQRRGVRTHLPLWTAPANIDHPEIVEAIHTDYINAGADIITSNTFRATQWTYKKVNKPKLGPEVARKAIGIAQKAISKANRNVFLAGSMTTLEDCYRPDLVPPIQTLEEEHGHQIEVISSMGIDFILAETINTLIEAEVIAQACHQNSIPFMLSFVTDGHGNLLGGDPLEIVVQKIEVYQPFAISLNCRPVNVLSDDLLVLKSCYHGATCLYANGPGEPDETHGWKMSEDDSLENYLKAAENWITQGVQIFGGCCGTTPEIIKACAEVI